MGEEKRGRKGGKGKGEGKKEELSLVIPLV